MTKLDEAVDVLLKLDATNQTYIVGHDIPVSISKYVYALLDEKRRKTADELGIPESQYEFEDLIMLLVGGITMDEVKAGVKAMLASQMADRSKR